VARIARLVLFSLLLTGCSRRLTTTATITIRDPSRVALLSGTRVIVPARSEREVAPVLLRKGTLSGGPDRFAATAFRAPNGEIAVEWERRGITNADELTLLSPGNNLAIAPAILTESPNLFHAPTLHLPYCASLTAEFFLTARRRRPIPVAYRATVAPETCSEDTESAIDLAIETPWDNVGAVRTSVTTLDIFGERSLMRDELVYPRCADPWAAFPERTPPDSAILDPSGIEVYAWSCLDGRHVVVAARRCDPVVREYASCGARAPVEGKLSILPDARHGPRHPREWRTDR
jgi:hypothetical protein